MECRTCGRVVHKGHKCDPVDTEAVSLHLRAVARAARSTGNVLGRGEVLSDYDAIFVRCYNCKGAGCESCGYSGFDWQDTLDVRATMRAVTGVVGM